MRPMRRIFVTLGILFLVGVGMWVYRRREIYFDAINVMIKDLDGNSTGRIFARAELEKSGNKMVRRGKYKKAIESYKESIEPKYINRRHEKSTSVGALVKVFKLQRNYERVLEFQNWFPVNPATIRERHEIEALNTFWTTGDPKKVYSHLQLLRNEEKRDLPPEGYGASVSIVVADIIRLYDNVKDYDAGIAFIDEVLAYFKKSDAKRGEDDGTYDRIKTVRDADACIAWRDGNGNKDSNYRACKLIREFLLVREAFEREKANGGPTCGEWGPLAEPQPGYPEYCIGDATKALIESDYFPW